MRKFDRLLWVLTIIGVLCSLPFLAIRSDIERSSQQIEFIFDYRDLLEVAKYQGNPAEYTQNQLAAMKSAGVNSLAIYESSLRELEMSGRIRLLSSREGEILTEYELSPSDNSTYVLFLNEESVTSIKPMVLSAFEERGVAVSDWNYQSYTGLRIELPRPQTINQTMEPDPITLRELQAAGFHIVARLSDQWPSFSAERMDRILRQLAENGVTRVVFDGTQVTGYRDNVSDQSLTAMANLMSQYKIGVAIIELAKPQLGLNKIAYLTDYNVVRLHSLPPNMSTMSPEDLAFRFTLAVTDRNIRMIYLNTSATYNHDRALYIDSIDNIITGLSGESGAIEQIKKQGYEIGIAVPFATSIVIPAAAELILKALIALGSIALITLLAGAFFPRFTIHFFILGNIVSAGLYLLSSSLLSQALALGVAVAAATLAIIIVMRKLQTSPEYARGRRFIQPIVLLLLATGISSLGIVFMIALLNHISYFYVIEQFRGTSVLHLAPLIFSILYFIFFHGKLRAKDVIGQFKRFILAKITVLSVILTTLVGFAVYYYMMRTGNAGQATDIERWLRVLLEEIMGVRPRTKEFLFAHPLFILGSYLFMSSRYRLGLGLIALASIGQLSMIGTFAHLHTPLFISMLRVCNGLILGTLIGLCLVAVWQWVEWRWRHWATNREPS
jgi:hypothetical protein